MLNYECKVETKSPIRRELTISVKPDSIRQYIDNQLAEVQKSAKVKGFREGKVPLSIIKQYYMKDVKSDVFSKIVRESYIKALEDNKIYAVGVPEIETKAGIELNEGEELTFTAKVEIFPEVKVGDLGKIKVTRQPTEVTDEDVDQSIQNLRDSHAEMITATDYEGPAKEGDFLEVSFKGSVEGKEHDSLKGDNRLVHIGSKQYMEEFENALIGLKKGETKDFTIHFPKEFGDKNMAGKPAQFSVSVHEFKQKQLPEVNDDFAKRFKMETSLELRKKVFETLKEDREKQSKDQLKENLLRALIEKHDFEVPNGLVRSQLEYLMKENAEYLARHNFTEKMVREYLDKHQGDLTKRAEEQVKASLILDKIAEEQNIKVEPADLDHEYSKIAERLRIPLEQVKQLYDNDENARRQLRFRLKEDRTTEYILGQVKISDAKKDTKK